MQKEQSVPKRQHIKFRRRRITKKKEYNIRNMAKVWNQEIKKKNLKCPFLQEIQWGNPTDTSLVFC